MPTVTDNFNRANGPVAAPWGQLGSVAPTPTIESGCLKCYGASYQMPDSSKDIDFSIRIATAFANGVWMQWGGSRHKYSDTPFEGYYCINDGAGNVQIFRKRSGIGGVVLDTATGKGYADLNDVLRMTRVGDTLSMFKNGTLMLAATDTFDPVLEKGFVGIFSNAGVEPIWDDFTATYTAPGPPVGQRWPRGGG